MRLVGRFEEGDGSGPLLGWGGSQIIARFEGTGLSATLDDWSGASHYDVIVDGALQPTPLVLTQGEATYTIVSGLSAGLHTVVLARRTEAMVSTTRLGEFIVAGGQLATPPPALTRRIEFIGDSSITGWGVECTDGNDDFSAPTQNERKTYAALASAALNAEHSNVAYSGRGVLRNFDPSNDEVMAILYQRSNPDNPDSTWGFNVWQPDLVWIALGGNDYNDSGMGPPDGAAFKAKYHELVALIREKNPNAHIIATIEGRLDDSEPPGWNTLSNLRTSLGQVVSERNAAGDAKVSFFELPRVQDGELNGCNTHTTAAFHARVAPAVTAEIRAKLGW